MLTWLTNWMNRAAARLEALTAAKIEASQARVAEIQAKTIAQKRDDLQVFFDKGGVCPDCGEKDWTDRQDGGHDVVFECNKCGSKFGIQLPPFNLIERIT